MEFPAKIVSESLLPFVFKYGTTWEWGQVFLFVCFADSKSKFSFNIHIIFHPSAFDI